MELVKLLGFHNRGTPMSQRRRIAELRLRRDGALERVGWVADRFGLPKRAVWPFS